METINWNGNRDITTPSSIAPLNDSHRVSVRIPQEDSMYLWVWYRSWYILKKKFTWYKKEIAKTYKRHRYKKKIRTQFDEPGEDESDDDDDFGEDDQGEGSNNTLIKTSSFPKVLEEVLLESFMSIIEITNPNELFISDWISLDKRKERQKVIIDRIYEFWLSGDYVKKYNLWYYDKKIKNNPLKDIYEKPEKEYPIVQYDRKGNIVYTFQQLNEMNNSVKKAKQPSVNRVEWFKEVISTNSSGLFFIEVLPVVIADFIQTFPNHAIVNTWNDSWNEEIANWFDKDIMGKISQENNMIKSEINSFNAKDSNQIKTLLLEQWNLMKSIKNYENILNEKKKNKDNVIYVEEILARLNKEKDRIDALIRELKLGKTNNSLSKAKDKIRLFTSGNWTSHLSSNQIKPIPEESANDSKTKHKKSNSNDIQNMLSKDAKRRAAFKEIFQFYSNQHNFAGITPLFETIQAKLNHWVLSEFCKFCVEFRINIPKPKIVELFKKNTDHFKKMKYSDFFCVWDKMADEYNKTEVANIKKKIEKTREQLNRMDTNSPSTMNMFRRQSVAKLSPDKKKESGVTSSHRVPQGRASILFTTKKREYQIELEKNSREWDRWNSFNSLEKFEEFAKFLSIDNPEEYRKKMKGFIIPFHNMKERNLFFESKVYNDHFGQHVIIKRDEIEKMKAERMKKQNWEKEIQRQKLFEAKNETFEKGKEMWKEHYTKRLKDKNYQNIKYNLTKAEMEENKRNNFSWNKLENTRWGDIELEKEDKELFIESDNSDDLEILKNWNGKSEGQDKDKGEITWGNILPIDESKIEPIRQQGSNVLITQQNNLEVKSEGTAGKTNHPIILNIEKVNPNNIKNQNKSLVLKPTSKAFDYDKDNGIWGKPQVIHTVKAPLNTNPSETNNIKTTVSSTLPALPKGKVNKNTTANIVNTVASSSSNVHWTPNEIFQPPLNSYPTKQFVKKRNFSGIESTNRYHTFAVAGANIVNTNPNNDTPLTKVRIPTSRTKRVNYSPTLVVNTPDGLNQQREESRKQKEFFSSQVMRHYTEIEDLKERENAKLVQKWSNQIIKKINFYPIWNRKKKNMYCS